MCGQKEKCYVTLTSPLHQVDGTAVDHKVMIINLHDFVNNNPK